MVSSKCGRLLVAAGLPVAAAGLTLAAAGSAGAAVVPVVHVVEITADASCDGHPAMVATQTHTAEHAPEHAVMTAPEHAPETAPEHARPGTMPVVATIRPVCTEAHIPAHIPAHSPVHAPGHVGPGVVPVLVTVRPVVAPAAKGEQIRPAHPVVQQGMGAALRPEKHEGVKIHVFHQTVILKIETTAFTVAGNQGSEPTS